MGLGDMLGGVGITVDWAIDEWALLGGRVGGAPAHWRVAERRGFLYGRVGGRRRVCVRKVDIGVTGFRVNVVGTSEKIRGAGVLQGSRAGRTCPAFANGHGRSMFMAA